MRFVPRGQRTGRAEVHAVDAGPQTAQGSASRHGLDLDDVSLHHSLDRQANALAFAQFGRAQRLEDSVLKDRLHLHEAPPSGPDSRL